MQRERNSRKEEMPENKNTVVEIENAFDRLVSTLHLVEERISELEDIPIETIKTGNQTEKKLF